ncbi:hypothetical protein ROZALSC1DRAFT_3756, partial [Rozella allomycis CSF55]
SLNSIDRFANVKKLAFTCSKCSKPFEFTGIIKMKDSSKSNLYIGYECPNCSSLLSPQLVYIQIVAAIRNSIRQYYRSFYICDNSQCGLKTNKLSVNGYKCPSALCSGRLYPTVSDAALYNQLAYFSYLFNPDKLKRNFSKTI